MSEDKLTQLGNTRTEYIDKYDATLLESIERAPRRKEYSAPMFGYDVWTCFEVSFLLWTGIPVYKVLRISNPAESEFIFESKSLKLYLNSFNNTVFKNIDEVLATIEKDLTTLCRAEVFVEVVKEFSSSELYDDTCCIEEAIGSDIFFDQYSYSKDLLKKLSNTQSHPSNISIFSDLLRSNCEITYQPDWGRVYINYIPDKAILSEIDFLKYIISYRTHQEFHEPTCERIYNDLYELLEPKELTVICQYTRRGGIDINPYRSSKEVCRKVATMLPKLIQQ